jgi:uncharacterized repeat protein (TIGR03803 family)
MQSKKPLILFVTACTVLFGFLAIAAPLFAASKEKVLYSFNGTDGATPTSSLIFDAAGNLYGTTYYGGKCTLGGCGTVFRLALGANGKWTHTVLYRFRGGKDGQFPDASLIFDAAGNLYGTTSGGGGNYSVFCQTGCGTVFELSRGTDGTWTETVLHSFNYTGNGGGGEGYYPSGSLIFDAAGNLYGTTNRGGASGTRCAASACGTVFELTLGTNGKWKEKVLHSFGKERDGSEPRAGLIFDATGSLYGTTWEGGASGRGCDVGVCGAVFELTPGTDGKWKEKVLHSFRGADGSGPSANLIFDAAGNLYGTTQYGGAHTYGTVFQLAPETNGRWGEKVLRSFYHRRFPLGDLILDAAGNLYGTTTVGGGSGCLYQDCGTVFQFVPGTGGKWTYRVLYRFDGGEDGYSPYAGLIFDAAGNLYSTTLGGGAYGYGTVFEITP